MSIESAIYSRLSGYAGLSAIVGNRIYPVKAPQNTAVPYVVWRRISCDRVSLLSSDTNISEPVYEFECFANEFDTARSVVEQVRLALQRYSGTVDSTQIMDVTIENDDDDYDDTENLFYSILETKITHRE